MNRRRFLEVIGTAVGAAVLAKANAGRAASLTNLYWITESGEPRVARGVRSDAVTFAIGASCTCGSGYIVAIDHDSDEYQCADSGLLLPNCKHRGIPRVTVERDGDGLLFVDRDAQAWEFVTGEAA